ncbi:MAG: gamma-glutamyl-gamma-aminobutyrate hydrolase family protein [Longimicrobiales bacterium]
MDSRVVIGVPAQTLQAMDGIPPGVPHSWVMSSRYFEVLMNAGAIPWMVPLLRDEVTLRGIYERLDGVFLAGGVDVDPTAYGDALTDACGRTDVDRDAVEIQLTRWAVAEGKPLLGICRGHQIINVALGGTLYQDTNELENPIKHDYYPTQGFARSHLAHEVDIAPRSRLAGLYGTATVSVNSMHHQGLHSIGDGLRVSATAPDGLAEAVEGNGGGWLVGVQWHPESLAVAGTRALLDSFVTACAAWRSTTRLTRSA